MAADNNPSSVRYRVKAQCFVNGTLHDPRSATGPIFVYSKPGLESDALVLAPEEAPTSIGGDAGNRQNTPPKGDTLLAELDAERAAHEKTKAALSAEINAHAAAKVKRDEAIVECETFRGKLADAIAAAAAADKRAAEAEAQLAELNTPPAPQPDQPAGEQPTTKPSKGSKGT